MDGVEKKNTTARAYSIDYLIGILFLYFPLITFLRFDWRWITLFYAKRTVYGRSIPVYHFRAGAGRLRRDGFF